MQNESFSEQQRDEKLVFAVKRIVIDRLGNIRCPGNPNQVLSAAPRFFHVPHSDYRITTLHAKPLLLKYRCKQRC